MRLCRGSTPTATFAESPLQIDSPPSEYPHSISARTEPTRAMQKDPHARILRSRRRHEARASFCRSTRFCGHFVPGQLAPGALAYHSLWRRSPIARCSHRRTSRCIVIRTARWLVQALKLDSLKSGRPSSLQVSHLSARIAGRLSLSPAVLARQLLSQPSACMFCRVLPLRCIVGESTCR